METQTADSVEKLRQHDQRFWKMFRALFVDHLTRHAGRVEVERFQVVETVRGERLLVEIPYFDLDLARVLTRQVGNTTIQSETVKSLRYRVIELADPDVDDLEDAFGVLQVGSPESKIIARGMEYSDAMKVALAMNLHILWNAVRYDHEHRPPVPENVDEVYPENRNYERLHEWMGIPLNWKEKLKEAMGLR